MAEHEIASVQVAISSAGGPATVAQLAQVLAATKALNGANVSLRMDTSAVKTAAAEIGTAETAIKRVSATPLTFNVNTAQIDQAAASLGKMESQALSAGSALSKLAAPAAFLGIGVGLTKMGADFQTLGTNIQNNTTASNADIAVMNETIKKLSAESGASLDDLAAGWMHAFNITGNAADATKVLTSAMESAVSTGSKTEAVTNSLAKVMHQFGISASDAGKAMDVLHLGAALGNTTLEDFVDHSAKAFVTASSLHVPLDQVTAGFVGLTRAGFDASQANTQLAGILTHIVTPSAAAKKELAELSKTSGIDLVSDFSLAGLKAKGLTGILQDLTIATAGHEDAMLRIIPAQRGAIGALALTGPAAKDVADAMKQLARVQSGELTPTTDAFARTQATLGNQLAVLRQQFKLAATDMGGDLVPAVTQFVSLFNSIPAGVKKVGIELVIAGAGIKAASSLASILAGSGALGLKQDIAVEAGKIETAAAGGAIRTAVAGIGRGLGQILVPIAIGLTVYEIVGKPVEDAVRNKIADLYQGSVKDIVDKETKTLNTSNDSDYLSGLDARIDKYKKKVAEFQQYKDSNEFKIAKIENLGGKLASEEEADRNAKALAVLQQQRQDFIDVRQNTTQFGPSIPADQTAAIEKAGEDALAESAKSAKDSIETVNKAFDGTVKALDSINQSKGIDGLLASMNALRDAQSNLNQLGISDDALDRIIQMGSQFQALAANERSASSAFNDFMAASDHTEGYIKQLDGIKSHYASLEQYIKGKPLSARTEADIEFLDKYNQRLATTNNEEDKLKERQVVDANKASQVEPDFTKFDSDYRNLVSQFGGENFIRFKLQLDVEDAARAASKAQYLLTQLTDHPNSIAIALSGDKDAEAAFKRLRDGETGLQSEKDITLVAKTLGISDLQTLIDLINQMRDRTVTITANRVVTGGGDASGGFVGLVPSAASGGTIAGNMAIVGDSPGGGINSTTEVVDFHNKRVYSNDQAKKMGLFGAGLRSYAGGDGGGTNPYVINANDPTAVTGPYTAAHPGPAGDLSSGKGGNAAAGIKAVTTEAQNLTRVLVDASRQTAVLSGYLSSLSTTNLKAVTSEFDHQFALLSKINTDALGSKATEEQKQAAVNAAMSQSLDVTIAFGRALSDAENPANDLSADFQKIYDTGTPIAANLVRQASILREIGIYTQKIKDDQQAINDIEAAHTKQQELDAAADRKASRDKTELGWANAFSTRKAEEAWTRKQRQEQDARAKEDRNWTIESRQWEDRQRNLEFYGTTQKQQLQDQLTGLEKTHALAVSATKAQEQLLSARAFGGDTSASMRLAIGHDATKVAEDAFTTQKQKIQDAITAEDKLASKQQFDLETQRLAETRAHEDRLHKMDVESTTAARNHDDAMKRFQDSVAAQEQEDTRKQWRLEDARIADENDYKAKKATAEATLKSDQDHAKALDDQLAQAQTIEGLWEKVYANAGDTANALLTAFAQITGATVIPITTHSPQAAYRNIGGLR